MTDTELNEAVARKMGGKPSGHPEQPQYSTSIAAAWEILENMRKNHFVTLDTVIAESMVGPRFDGPWSVEIHNGPYASADTAPRAICEAFLKLEER